MNLVPYTLTALSRQDIPDTPTDRNIVIGAVVTCVDSQGATVTMFDDAAGSNGSTAKQTGVNGQVTVYVPAGEYTFSVNGNQFKVVVGAVGAFVDADALAAPDSTVLVGGVEAKVIAKRNNISFLSVATVAEAVALDFLSDGDMIKTSFYNVPVESVWEFVTAEPSAPIFYIPANGGFLKLLTGNFASAGIVYQDTYNAEVAWSNRNLINKLCQDARFSHLKFGHTGVVWVLGTILPNRSNFNFEVETGVTLKGRYDDPSIPSSVGAQAGAMLDMTIRGNYYIDGSLANTGQVKNTAFIIDGEIGTYFDASHSQLNNNNAAAGFNALDCQIAGRGGVISSDHRGANFDGLCDNCLIDLAYIRGTISQPINMNTRITSGIRGGGYGKVKVGMVSNVPFGGLAGTAAVVQGVGGTIDIEIGSFEWDGVTKPQLVQATLADEVNVTVGLVNGVVAGLRSLDSQTVRLKSGRFLNTTCAVSRAGAATDADEVYIKNVKSADGSMTAAMRFDTNPSALKVLSIEDCDFSLCGSSFQYRGGTLSPTPLLLAIENNRSPIHGSWVAADYNILPNKRSDSLGSGASFTYQLNTPDRNYNKITFVLTVSTVRYPLTIGLDGLTYTGAAQDFQIAGATVTATFAAGAVTFVASGGSFAIAYAHN